MKSPDLLEAWRQNPFFILELPTTASRAEVERAGQKLLALLAIGNAGARTCQTPLGALERDADLVRKALAQLRDPHARIVHELWATVLPDESRADGDETGWEQAAGAIQVRDPWSSP